MRLCHTPQTIDPDTGNTVDLKVMIHKIHMGSQLPSVQAGKPYQIIGNQGSVNDWSTVVYPSDPRRCEACHEQESGATQATGYLTAPTRASCGSCHDDVNFATGRITPADRRSAITNARPATFLRANWSSTLRSKARTRFPRTQRLARAGSGNSKVENGTAGQKPTVTFTVKDKSGAAVPSIS